MDINGMKCKWMEINEYKWAEHQDWMGTRDGLKWNKLKYDMKWKSEMQMNGDKWI